MNTPSPAPPQSLRWGILGTGAIAKTFAAELPFSETGRLVAVASRDSGRASDFASTVGKVTAHGDYDQLLKDPNVDAVYVSTPHPFHAEWATAALRAGKHVLCEKPLAMNLAEVEGLVEEASRQQRFLMEAFMYRCHPRTARVVELVKSGLIGRILLIEASFSFAKAFDPESRIFKPSLGGGGILDVGCYAMSVARLIAGASHKAPFENPSRIQGAILPAPTGVDLVAAATLKFDSGILAQISCGVGLSRDQDLVIHGEDGRLRVPQFWNPPGVIHIESPGEVRTEPASGSPHKYAVEADVVAWALPDLESPHMSWADSLGNASALDVWLAAPR